MSLWDETGALKGQISIADKAHVKATERQWQLIDLAIKAYSQKYPMSWNTFVIDQQKSKNENDYVIAKEGDLKKSGYRHTASFPVVTDETGQVIDSLYPVLEKIIPGLTHKKSLNFIPFLKRHPIFNPGHRIGASE